MSFEYSKNILTKIKNKKDFTPNELMTIERSLRLYEVNEEMLNYQIGLDKNNRYELTERVGDCIVEDYTAKTCSLEEELKNAEQIYEAFDKGLISLDDIMDISQKDGFTKALSVVLDYIRELEASSKSVREMFWICEIGKKVEEMLNIADEMLSKKIQGE